MLFLVNSSVSFAAESFSFNLPATLFSSWVASLSTGPAWESAANNQTFYLAPEMQKTYSADNVTHSLQQTEFFLGVSQPLPENLQSQLGIELAATGDAALSGHIWDDASPIFDNYTYKYQVKHRHVALKGKLLMDNGYPVIPWISVGVGLGFNEAHGFTNTPLISEAVMMSSFANKTTAAFTYTLGVGMQHNITQHTQLGIGYEFSDWGQSRLGRAAGQTLNSGLSLSHLYTSGFLFNITYQA